jgi:hypothetical protein
MNTIYFDYAVCPCGKQTAVRPTKLALSSGRPQPSETYEPPILVACPQCNRVYSFDTSSLVAIPVDLMEAQNNPASSTRVFQVSISCDGVECKARPVVHVSMSANTTEKQLHEERSKWRWANGEFRCSDGHLIPWPQWEHGGD